MREVIISTSPIDDVICSKLKVKKILRFFGFPHLSFCDLSPVNDFFFTALFDAYIYIKGLIKKYIKIIYMLRLHQMVSILEVVPMNIVTHCVLI